MTKASDNAFPSLLITEGTEPSAPAAGKQRLYIDSTTHKLKRTDSSGTDVTIESAGSGNVATDTIWDAAGDLVQGTGADTAAKLSAGTAGMFLKSAGAAAANLWAYPPGTEVDYVQTTSPVTFTATTEGAATTIITGNAVAYNGSTDIYVEFFASGTSTVSGKYAVLFLYDGSSSIGWFGIIGPVNYQSTLLRRKLTPSNATHTYSIRAMNESAGTGTVRAGAGGSGDYMPMYIRITRA